MNCCKMASSRKARSITTIKPSALFQGEEGDTIRVTAQVRRGYFTGDGHFQRRLQPLPLLQRRRSRQEATILLTLPVSTVYMIEIHDGSYMGNNGSYSVQSIGKNRGIGARERAPLISSTINLERRTRRVQSLKTPSSAIDGSTCPYRLQSSSADQPFCTVRVRLREAAARRDRMGSHNHHQVRPIRLDIQIATAPARPRSTDLRSITWRSAFSTWFFFSSGDIWLRSCGVSA